MIRYGVSIVIPCFNESNTLAECVGNILAAFEPETDIDLTIIIVDDGSSDESVQIAGQLAGRHPEITLEKHAKNRGKGAALRTGIQLATGDFVAIHDADLEYDPQELVKLLGPLKEGKADVVYGSRFLSAGAHRVLYFWHSMGNRFLTFFSNMMTDLNLTDMETCYKVFRREVIQSIDIQEDRFGFEPEVTAKVAEKRLRIYEMGISYFGRTYEEGKKIGVRDGLRAIYCILKYNANRAPAPLQFIIYVFIGLVAAIFNMAVFALLLFFEVPLEASAAIAFGLAAALNYLLCILLLFRHKAKWNTPVELAIYLGVVGALGFLDVFNTRLFVSWGWQPLFAKGVASLIGLVLNFLGRRFLVFPEPGRGPWQRQIPDKRK